MVIYGLRSLGEKCSQCEGVRGHGSLGYQEQPDQTVGVMTWKHPLQCDSGSKWLLVKSSALIAAAHLAPVHHVTVWSFRCAGMWR